MHETPNRDCSGPPPAAAEFNVSQTKMNAIPHIGFTHDENIPREFLTEFEESVRADGLEVQFHPIPSGTAYAGIEWLMQTAIVAYVAKPYFECFLKEMGKDHYNLLKEGFKKLYAKVSGPRAPEVTLIATAGKVAKEQPYSSLRLPLTSTLGHDLSEFQ